MQRIINAVIVDHITGANNTGSINTTNATVPTPFENISDGLDLSLLISHACEQWCIVKANKSNNLITITTVFDTYNMLSNNWIINSDLVSVEVVLIAADMAWHLSQPIYTIKT